MFYKVAKKNELVNAESSLPGETEGYVLASII